MQFIWLSRWLALAGLIAVIAITIIMARSLVAPLKSINLAAKLLAGGDITRQLPDSRKQKNNERADEIGEIEKALRDIHLYMEEQVKIAGRLA